MPLYLNNCKNRPHTQYYEPDQGQIPFYDLDREGSQATKAVNPPKGTECIVVAPEGTRDVRFDWFRFSHEAIRPAPEGEDVRVFFGTKIRSEVLPHSQAVSAELYSMFFDRNGHFKRGSVIAHTS